MKLKYWGESFEAGMTLTADLFDNNMGLVHAGFPMTEVNGSNYTTADIFNTINTIPKGVYVMRVEDTVTGEFMSHQEIWFDGVKAITLLDISLMTDVEKMQFRDALGLDGDKVVARGGQLQKKSEYPSNNVIDTTKLNQ